MYINILHSFITLYNYVRTATFYKYINYVQLNFIMIYNNYKSIKENFDFNEVLTDNQNNTEINNISTILLMKEDILIYINKLIKSSNYKKSSILYSDDYKCIIIRFVPIISTSLSYITVRFHIEDDNILYLDYKRDNYQQVEEIDILYELIISILDKLIKTLNIHKYEIAIIRESWETKWDHTSEINGYKSLVVNYEEIKFILYMINNGYSNIQYKLHYDKDKVVNFKTIYNKNYNFGNIVYNPQKYNSYKLDKTKFIDYAVNYLIPNNGYIAWGYQFYSKDKET